MTRIKPVPKPRKPVRNLQRSTLAELDEIEYKLDCLQQERSRWLIRRGWINTSNTPGCFWMWQKTLRDGRVVLVDADVACRYEREEAG